MTHNNNDGISADKLGFIVNMVVDDSVFDCDNNLFFNQQYEVILNYPMPGRNYKFTLKFKF